MRPMATRETRPVSPAERTRPATGATLPRIVRSVEILPSAPTVRGSPPPVPPIAVRRARLEHLLDAHPERRIVLVHGPAGAGKTVLVAQWLAHHGHGAAWLTLDGTEEAAHLAQRLLESVRGASVGHAGRPAASAPADEAVLRDALDALVAASSAPRVIVLDGVDRLRDAGSRRFVARLVERPPDGIRLVLAARAKPRLGIERARLREDLVEVGPQALRFRRDEIEALVAAWPEPAVDAAQLDQATLGWAAGLRLVHLDAAGGEDAGASLAVPGDVAGAYVREELVETSSPGLQAFLEVTCWLPVLTGPLCAAVAQAGPSEHPMAPSDVEALPLVPVASRPKAFRFPPVLVQALQQEYGRRDARAATCAMGRAAESARRCGELVTAVEIFLQAGRPQDAAEACADLAAAGESSLRHVDELLRRRPGLVPAEAGWAPWRVRAAAAAGRVDEAATLLGVASDMGAAGPDERDALTARAVVAENLGDATTLLACADRLQRAAGPAGDVVAALTARCWRARALTWSGDMAGARAELAALQASGASGGTQVLVAVTTAWVAWFDGEMGRAAAAVTAAEAAEHEQYDGELALLAGAVHREANQPALATPRLQEAMASPHVVVASLAASELARCHRAAGATMKALEVVVSARSTRAALPAAVDVHLRATEAQVRLDRGDVAGAHAVVRAAPSGVGSQLLAARVALRQAPARAAELLQAVVARTPRHSIEKLLLRAQLPNATSAEVSVALMKAVSEGEPRRLVRTFLDEGPAVCRRFPELALESSDRSLGRIAALACEELAHAPAPEQVPPVEQLTARELAVLRMLPLRLSNREMAAQLYISVNTLKTHVRAIYRKLDVPHRSAAVSRAKALELV